MNIYSKLFGDSVEETATDVSSLLFAEENSETVSRSDSLESLLFDVDTRADTKNDPVEYVEGDEDDYDGDDSEEDDFSTFLETSYEDDDDDFEDSDDDYLDDDDDESTLDGDISDLLFNNDSSSASSVESLLFDSSSVKPSIINEEILFEPEDDILSEVEQLSELSTTLVQVQEIIDSTLSARNSSKIKVNISTESYKVSVVIN